MSLEKIQSAVLEAAKREAELILHQAQKHAEDRTARALEAIRAETEHEFVRQSRQIEEELSQRLSQQEAQARKELLQRQNALLVKVFERAHQQLLQMPREQYREVMAKLLASAAGNAGGKVRVHPDDTGVFEEVLAHLNQHREEKARVALAGDQPLPKRGGFIFLGGVYEVDYTADALVETLRHEEGPRVASTLFPKPGGGD